MTLLAAVDAALGDWVAAVHPRDIAADITIPRSMLSNAILSTTLFPTTLVTSWIDRIVDFLPPYPLDWKCIFDPQVLHILELFNHFDDVRAWAKDRDGHIRWVNRTTLLLYSPNDPAGGGIMGKTDHELFPAFLADQYLLDDEYVLAGNRIVDRIEMNRLPDGTSVWHVTNKVPLVGRDGTTVGTAGITRPLDKSEASATGTEFGPVLAHMRDYHDTPITNQQLARLAHMSLRTFERKFLSCFHLTPQAYLRKLRLRMASHALVYTNEPMSVVAASCGYVDQSHFSREFRRHFGQSPREYREHYVQVRAGGGSDSPPARSQEPRPAAPAGSSSILPRPLSEQAVGILSTKLGVAKQDKSSLLCFNLTMKLLVAALLLFAPCLALAASPAQPDLKKDMVLWYRRPATRWNEAMPMGNGLMGAMVFGGVRQERIALNESSFWSGRPHDYNDPKAIEYFPQIRDFGLCGQVSGGRTDGQCTLLGRSRVAAVL